MPVTTHCLPGGVLGTNEIPTPNVSGANITAYVPAGAKRGVLVCFHGLGIVKEAVPLAPTGALLSYCQQLATDGWIALDVTYPEGMTIGVATQAIFNDVNADTGHGARFLLNTQHWWDHILAYVRATYGTSMPVGISSLWWGGWHAVKILNTKPAGIIGAVINQPVTVLSDTPASFTTPVDFTGLNTTGLNIASTDLNALAVPAIIGWGTNDTVAGFANIQALYNAAHAAGAPITSNPTTQSHVWSAADTTTFLGWIASTLDPLYPAVH